MAKAIVGAGGIETISGALKRPKKQNGHSHGNYLVMTHRTAPTTSPDCQRIYAFAPDRYKRSTEPTADEQLARNKFSAVSKAVTARMQDMSKLPADQAAFKNQSTYKTFRQYLWALESEAYQG